MEEAFKLLPKLFVNKMVKIWMNKDIKVMAQLSKFVKWNQKN